MLRLGVLVSGNGSNLQAIIDNIENGYIPNTQIAVVISNNPDAYALIRAKDAGINTEIIHRKMFKKRTEFEHHLVETLQDYGVDLVLLAGFMVILGKEIIRAFPNRIMNIHPALVPAFSGKGFYGRKVHESVLEYGVKLTGATVHFVTEDVDGGPVILQEAIPVFDDDTIETLQKRVLEIVEWQIYSKAVKLYAEHRIEIDGRKVRIRK